MTTTNQEYSVKFIQVNQLTPNPINPRIGVPDKLEAIAESIKTNGFYQEKPLLVRPLNGTYQIIGGHSRFQAARIAGLESVPCIVQEMTDEQSILRLAQDNLCDPFPWYSLALYVAQNSDKGSKKGLSRAALIQACTGKTGSAAKSEGTRKGAVGELLIHLGVGLQDATLVEQDILDKLLNPEFNRTQHLYEISKAEQQDWALLTVSLLEESWTVEQCKAAVEGIKRVCDIPQWLHPVFPPQQYKLECIGNEELINDLQQWVDTAQYHYDALPNHREVKRCTDEEYSVEYWNLQQLFVDSLQDMKAPSAKKINQAAKTVLDAVSELDNQFTDWQKARESKEEAARQSEQRQIKELEQIEKYTPVGIHHSRIKALEALQAESFDLILTQSNPQLYSIEFELVISESAPLLKPGGLMVFLCDYSDSIQYKHTCECAGLDFVECLIWEMVECEKRENAHPLTHKLILVFSSPGRNYHFNKEHDGSVLHHESKEQLWQYLINVYSQVDAAALDPFGADALTGMAAKQSQRLCTWIEESSKLFDEASSKIEKVKFWWQK